MPRKKKTYEVVGTTPVLVDGKYHQPGDTFESAEEVSFLLGVGALKEKKK